MEYKPKYSDESIGLAKKHKLHPAFFEAGKNQRELKREKPYVKGAWKWDNIQKASWIMGIIASLLLIWLRGKDIMQWLIQ